MAEPAPSPLPRAPVTQTWETSRRDRIRVLTAANEQLTKENVVLNQDLLEIERRVRRVREECGRQFGDALARRIDRILDGEPN